MKRKSSQKITQTKKIKKKNSYISNKSNLISYNTNTIKTNKLDYSLTSHINNRNNDIKKNEKSKNKTHINLYKKPLKNINKTEKTKIEKSEKNDYFSLMNISNDLLYNSINEGRKAINNSKFYKQDLNEKNNTNKNNKKYNNKTVDYKLKDKTNSKKDVKDNYCNSIINKKRIKDIKDIKERIKVNKRYNNFKNIKNNNNSKTNLNNENYTIIGSVSRSRKCINNITQRLFSKETISSKNKLKKNLLYTPKKKINDIRNKRLRLRAKTCQINSKKIIKTLLTSQNTESRFYTTKTLSPKEHKKKIRKRNSITSKINYAFENIQNYNKKYNISFIQSEEINDNKENKENNNNINKINNNNPFNTLNNNETITYLINKTKEKSKPKGGLISKLINSNKNYENKKAIHDFLYHYINSPLSLEIIISESKGVVNTKCPLGHLKKFKFHEFYQKFRAIPDFNITLICFICKKFNNLNNFFCGKCYNFLCHTCQSNHEGDFGHQIISIQNINTYCSLHNKKYIIFCYDCNKNCCELCHNIESKNHKFKTFQDILIDFKKEEKSIGYIKNEIQNQLKLINEFKNRYKEDLKTIENNILIEEYFEEYINYFRNLLKLKEKLISKYSYNSNNYYNIMNVLNLSLPIFYNYKKEHLFKLSPSNELYNKYITINKIISFINNNSIKIFEGHQNHNKFNSNINKMKIYRTIKPSKVVDINNIENKKITLYNDISSDKYPKQILDIKYNGYFLLIKDKSFDVIDRDLNFIKNYNMTKKFGDTYNEIIIGAELLDNKNIAFYNYKKILIIQFSYDFLSYKEINEYDLKINTNNLCNNFNNFDYSDGFTEKNYNSFINKIIDINKNEILSFGVRFGEHYICSIWDKNKEYDNQVVDINSNLKNDIYPIYSVLKYNEKKFAILENCGNSFNVKIYEYETQFKEEKNDINKNIKGTNTAHKNEKNINDIEEINKNDKEINKENSLKENIELIKNENIEKKEKGKKDEENKNKFMNCVKTGKENFEINSSETNKNNNNKNNYIKNDIINNNIIKMKEINSDITIIKKEDIINNKKEDLKIKINRYENDDNNLSEDSEENIDKILEEIKINTQKREEEYLKSQIEKNKQILSLGDKNNKTQNKNIFKEVFNLKNIQFKTEDSSPEEIIQQIVLIKINNKLFGFLDKEYFIIINFITCEVVSKIFYGLKKLIYIDKTPNDNFLFKENNKIISYTLRDNDLIRINLPVFEYNKNDKNISSWFLISGSIEFINKAKIIDDNFMISLFELRMEKWNLNNNFK